MTKIPNSVVDDFLRISGLYALAGGFFASELKSFILSRGAKGHSATILLSASGVVLWVLCVALAIVAISKMMEFVVEQETRYLPGLPRMCQNLLGALASCFIALALVALFVASIVPS